MGVFDSLKKKRPEHGSPEASPEASPGAQTVSGAYQVGDTIDNTYEIRQILGGPGKSGMGIVYICYNLVTRMPVALKTFQDRFLTDHASVERFEWEAEAWVRLETHYNIVRAYYVDMINDRPYIALEYVAGDNRYAADLSGWISRGGLRHNDRPDVPLILNFSLQFCHGMIHASRKFQEMGNPFVHRDVKPSNILVTQDKVVKLTDFGLVKALQHSSVDIPSTIIGEGPHQSLTLSKSGRICGTPPYMSPEQCLGRDDIDERSDIYSFGCVLYEMLTGRHVFEAKTAEEFLRHHLSTPPRSPNSHPHVDKVVLRCLEKQESKRYQAFEELEEEMARVYRDLTGKIVRPPEALPLEAWELHNRAKSLLHLGYLDEAISSFQEAVRIDPNLAEARSSLGLAYQAKGQLGTAIGEIREALRINPHDPLAHINLGNAYFAKGQLDDALAEYREALRVDPNSALAHGSMGVIYRAKGQLDDAITEYKKGLAINPQDARLHYDLGNAYDAKGQMDKAMAEFREAVRIDPNDADAHNNLGNAYSDKGQLDHAMAEYREALRVDPNSALAHGSMGNAYAAKGQLDDAIAEYQQSLTINPRDARLHYSLGYVYDAKGQLDKAIAEFREALTIDPNDADTHNNLALAYVAQGQIDAAITELRDAVKVNPNHLLAHKNLGIAYKDKGQLDDAIAEFRRALTINAKDPLTHFNLAIAYKAKGKHRQAIESYQAFVLLAPPQYASYIQNAKQQIRELKGRL